MKYHQWWSARQNVADFGQCIRDAWASEYLLSTGADPEDLVVVDPGNGFNYLFDLADALPGESRLHPPRVVDGEHHERHNYRPWQWPGDMPELVLCRCQRKRQR